MNDIQQYDEEKAAEELDRHTSWSVQNSPITRCAAGIVDEDGWMTSYQSVKYGSVWRLVVIPKEGVVEEVVLTFQGVIYAKDLAPFNPKMFHEKPNSARFLRQSITLCGLKTPLFQKATGAVLEIHALLARSVGQDEMEKCSMVSFDEDGEMLLNMGNRYLTPKKEVGGATALPIPSHIDPQGYLARAAGNNFVYTDENHVRFYERRRIPGSEETKFEECKLVIFRAGDIVEAQVAFIIISLRDGKKKTSMVLRSLLLLDGTVTQRSMVAQMLQRDEAPKVEHPLKRRVGYNDEEDKSKKKDDKEEDETVRPTIRRKVGYSLETVSETTQCMSAMEIKGRPSNGADVD